MSLAVGQRVRVPSRSHDGHHRTPAYLKGRQGTIERIQGCHVFPDTGVTGEGENPQWLYTVVFDGRTLWGEKSDPSVRVSIEAFEPDLEAEQRILQGQRAMFEGMKGSQVSR